MVPTSVVGVCPISTGLILSMSFEFLIASPRMSLPLSLFFLAKHLLHVFTVAFLNRSACTQPLQVPQNLFLCFSPGATGAYVYIVYREIITFIKLPYIQLVSSPNGTSIKRAKKKGGGLAKPQRGMAQTFY